MPIERVGNQLRTMTYKDIKEFINEQREIEKGAVLKKHKDWTRDHENKIVSLRKLFERAQLEAIELKKADPFSRQKWVNVKGLSKIITDKGLGGKWKMGYSVNHLGVVQFFHRKVPDSVRIYG